MSEFRDGKIPDREPRNAAELGAVIVVALFFGGMILAALLQDFTIYKLSVPFFLISWVVLLVLHESGHALVALALGWSVDKVCIGSGRRVATLWIGGMPVEFRAIPLSGFALPRPQDMDRPRTKQFLIYAAGPGIELLSVLLILALAGSDTLFNLRPDLFRIGLQSFCVAAVFGAVTNLIPLYHQIDGGRAWSDGLGMILSWRLPDRYFRERIDERPPDDESNLPH